MTGCMVASSLGIAPALHLAGGCEPSPISTGHGGWRWIIPAVCAWSVA
jgi:hypothetical protein